MYKSHVVFTDDYNKLNSLEIGQYNTKEEQIYHLFQYLISPIFLDMSEYFLNYDDIVVNTENYSNKFSRETIRDFETDLKTDFVNLIEEEFTKFNIVLPFDKIKKELINDKKIKVIIEYCLFNFLNRFKNLNKNELCFILSKICNDVIIDFICIFFGNKNYTNRWIITI